MSELSDWKRHCLPAELARVAKEEREACAKIVEQEANIAHDDWNDRNLGRQLMKVAEQIRERT